MTNALTKHIRVIIDLSFDYDQSRIDTVRERIARSEITNDATHDLTYHLIDLTFGGATDYDRQIQAMFVEIEHATNEARLHAAIAGMSEDYVNVDIAIVFAGESCQLQSVTFRLGYCAALFGQMQPNTVLSMWGTRMGELVSLSEWTYKNMDCEQSASTENTPATMAQLRDYTNTSHLVILDSLGSPDYCDPVNVDTQHAWNLIPSRLSAKRNNAYQHPHTDALDYAYNVIERIYRLPARESTIHLILDVPWDIQVMLGVSLMAEPVIVPSDKVITFAFAKDYFVPPLAVEKAQKFVFDREFMHKMRLAWQAHQSKSSKLKLDS